MLGIVGGRASVVEDVIADGCSLTAWMDALEVVCKVVRVAVWASPDEILVVCVGLSIDVVDCNRGVSDGFFALVTGAGIDARHCSN